MLFRFPTGKNVYSNAEWEDVSFGNNEIKIGPVFQFNFIKKLYAHLNLFYLFREGNNEGFYNGFTFNLKKKETYKKIFGFNPNYRDTHILYFVPLFISLLPLQFQQRDLQDVAISWYLSLIQLQLNSRKNHL